MWLSKQEKESSLVVAKLIYFYFSSFADLCNLFSCILSAEQQVLQHFNNTKYNIFIHTKAAFILFTSLTFPQLEQLKDL